MQTENQLIYNSNSKQLTRLWFKQPWWSSQCKCYLSSSNQSSYFCGHWLTSQWSKLCQALLFFGYTFRSSTMMMIWVCEYASVSYYLRCAEMTFYFFRHWIQTEYLYFCSLNLKLIESISTSQVCTLFFSISLHRNW